jgi:hypothetical protein
MLVCFARRAVMVAAAAAALTACSGGAPVNTTPSFSDGLTASSPVLGDHIIRTGGQVFRYGGLRSGKAPAGSGWMSHAVKNGGVLYGSSYDGGFINIYPVRGNEQQPIGHLTSGLLSPQGMTVDKHHNLWVANTNAFTVVAFRRGSTTPFRTLKDPGYYPLSVAVDGNGTVYAANAAGLSGPPGNVTVWAKGKTKPSAVLTYPTFLIVSGVAVDASNNLYVSFIPTSGPPAMLKFTPGSQTGQPVNIQGVNEGEMAFDSSGNLVMETLQNNLGIWAPPFTSGPARTIPAFGNEPTLNNTEHKVWVAYANFSTPHILGYNYNTGKLVDTISSGWTSTAIPYGVAIDPPALP